MRAKFVFFFLGVGMLLSLSDNVWAASRQNWVLWEEVIGKKTITALALKTWPHEKDCLSGKSPDKLPSYLILNSSETPRSKIFEHVMTICLPIGITPLVSVPKPSGLTHRGKEPFR